MLQFSVIVPTKDRPKELAMCLESFKNLNYPNEAWELIVVNDGGTSSFSGTTSGLMKSLPMRLVNIEHAGPGAARNAGAKLARGKYLAFTDDDCHIGPDWLVRFSKGFEEGTWDALGGRTLNPFPENIAAETYQHIIDFLYDYLTDETGNALFLVSNNVAYRRSTFEALGGFNETFTIACEDRELSFRLLENGHRQRYWPKSKVWHYRNFTWHKYIGLQFEYGRGDYHFKKVLKQYKTDHYIKPPHKISYYNALARNMRFKKMPLFMCMLVAISHIAHKTGHIYQNLYSKLSIKNGV